MRFTLCRGNYLGEPYKCYYPHQHVVRDEETLQEAVSRDYVGALYFENRRCSANFICSNVVIMDVDNTHSDNPEDWVMPKDVQKDFPDVCFAIHYSRNHMQEEDGRSARPKFHVIYPCTMIRNAKRYADIKKKLYHMVPYFDPKALDAGHCFFGSENPQVEFFEGRRSITEFLDEYDAAHPEL